MTAEDTDTMIEPQFFTAWEREDYERKKAGLPELGPLGSASAAVPCAPGVKTASIDVQDGLTVYVESPIHAWFGLTYSSYFVMPRLALENLPLDWQERFVALMNEAHDTHHLTTPSDYAVRRRDHGRFMSDPWADYRHGDFAKISAAQHDEF